MKTDGKTGKREWRDLAEIVANRAQTLLWTPQGSEALDYLRGRGFEDEWIERAELGFIPHYTKWHGLSIPPGISIPSRSGGVLTQIRIRNPKPPVGKPKYMSVSGGKLRKSLWGIDWIKPNRGVIVFEGEFNALCAWQMGFNAVATTSATNKIDQPEHMLKLMAAPWLMSWFDDDPAGDTARANLPRCDCHLNMFDDLNGLVVLDKELGTNHAREWLTDRIFFIEDDLPHARRYLDDSTIARLRAHMKWLDTLIYGFTPDLSVSDFEDASIFEPNQLVSLYEQPRPACEQPTLELSPLPAQTEQQALFPMPTRSHYSYGA